MKAVHINEIQLALTAFRQLLAKKVLTAGVSEEGGTHHYDYEFDYEKNEYITYEELNEYIFERLADENITNIQRFAETIISVVDSSGIMAMAVHDAHFPPIARIDLNPFFKDMAKFCIAVFTTQKKNTITVDEIEQLLNENVEQFSGFMEGFEAPKLKRETAEEIYAHINIYFV